MNRYVIRIIALVAAPFVVAAGLAVAQTSTGSDREARPVDARWGGGHHKHRPGFGGRAIMRDMLHEADADDDGRITTDEVAAFRQARLEDADGDGDGALSLDEFGPAFYERIRPLMVDAFQALDHDGDGRITEAELADRTDRMVERFDRNGDGVLSREDRRHGWRH